MTFVCVSYESLYPDSASGVTESDVIKTGLTRQYYALFVQELRRQGVWLGGGLVETLEPGSVLHKRNGQVCVSEASPSQTRLKSLLIFSARDLNHAYCLMAGHPDLQTGSVEIQTYQELSLQFP